MRILVAGSAGFLGTNLCHRLLSEGHEVIGADNLYTGSFQNVSKLDGFPKFKFFHHDVNTPINFDIEAVINFASPASPIHYQRDPIYTLKTNIIGTSNLLELAHAKGAVYLQASTSEVYGDPEVSPQHESYWGKVNPIGIRSCYDEGKRAAETLVMDFNRLYGLDTRIARIFNTYGPHMAVNDGRVVSNLVTQALKNQPLTIYGDGNQVRSFCYVDDLIEGIVSLLTADSIHEPINLGNPQPITMNQLAEDILRITGSKSKKVFLGLPQDDPRTRTPDITRAKVHLDWEPKVDREEGLIQTVNYFKGII